MSGGSLDANDDREGPMQQTPHRKNVVMTGGTSGLGLIAARQIAADADVNLIVGARGSAKANTGVVLNLDLMDLNSVRSFAEQVRSSLGGGGIDALVLNAGLARSDVETRTRQGYEATFAVNHLAHYLLLRLMFDHLNDGATVVLTSSGTHDPANRSNQPPPRHADAVLLAHPDRDPGLDAAPEVAGGRAYAASKLCNILTASHAQRLAEAERRRLTIMAFDPGPTAGTGLMRNFGLAANLMWRLSATPLKPLLPGFSKIPFNTPQDAGRALSDLAFGLIEPPGGRRYASLRGGRLAWPDPSELARSEEAMRALWNDSATLVGLSP
jgi:NAD(P)-dependent dehydrogenase (short-subunit alcohol dehydrogenase family)